MAPDPLVKGFFFKQTKTNVSSTAAVFILKVSQVQLLTALLKHKACSLTYTHTNKSTSER